MVDVLFLLTFLVHILVVHVLIGGLPVLLFTDWLAVRTKHIAYGVLENILIRVLPFFLIGGILLGIGTLLLSHVRYGPSIYGAGIAIGRVWMVLVLVLIALFYGLHIFKEDRTELKQDNRLRYILGSAMMLGLLFVTFLFVSVTVLMMIPEQWSGVQSNGFMTLLSLPTVMPRFFHIVVASLAATGCMVILYGVALHSRLITNDDLSPSETIDYGIYLTRYGGFWTMAGTVPQIVVGPWLLWSLPDHVRAPLVSGGTFGSIVFFVSLTSALFALVLLNASVVAPQYRWLALGGVGSLIVTFATMVVVRQEVRQYWTVGREELVQKGGGGAVGMGLWDLLFFLLLGLVLAWYFLKRKVPYRS